MLKRNGENGIGHSFWTLHVPEEHCKAGLEVSVLTNELGVCIGGQLITWQDLDAAKEKATAHANPQ